MREPSAVPFEPPAMGSQSEWRRWMSNLGGDFRRVRQFLGLSQDDLARYSGVSQGAISRLESGRGLHTPFSILVKINVVLAAALHQRDPASLSEDVRGFLAFMEYLAPPRFRGSVPESGPALTLSRDEALERLTLQYLSLPARERSVFVALMDAAAKTLAA